MSDENAISLDNLAGGELKEQVNDALQRVIDNIADPNTNWKSKRKLSVTLAFSADEKRNLAVVTMEVKPTLAAAAPSMTRIIIDRDSQGKVVGAEYRPAPMGFQQAMVVDKETGEFTGYDTVPAGLKVVK